MKEKKNLLGILALTALFIFPSTAKAGQLTELDNFQDQLNVFIDNVNSWYGDAEGETGKYWDGFAVTDLDQDGQIEVIKCSFAGTGFVTDIEICQNVPDEGMTIISNDSTGDMGGRDIFTVYQDPESGVKYYMVEDFGRDGAAYNYLTKMAMCYSDYNLSTQNLAKHEEIYDPAGGEKKDLYTDGQGNEITWEEFDDIEGTMFRDFGKHTVIINWIDKPSDASLGDLRSLLEQSAEGFYYGDAKVSKWFLNNGSWYYFDENGEAVKGWNVIGNTWYCFYGDSRMMTGWQQIDGSWYYFNGSGAMVTGWQQIDGSWYYFNGSGAMVYDWQQIDGSWYYFNGSGTMVTGWQVINGSWYYFNGSGAMVTGWQVVNGSWYYFNGSGAMVTGWQVVNGSWYYFNGSGAMVTGWQVVNGSWYYFNGSGAMVTGWQVINGSWYYFNGSGAMASSTWIGNCYVNESGVWV